MSRGGKNKSKTLVIWINLIWPPFFESFPGVLCMPSFNERAAVHPWGSVLDCKRLSTTNFIKLHYKLERAATRKNMKEPTKRDTSLFTCPLYLRWPTPSGAHISDIFGLFLDYFWMGEWTANKVESFVPPRRVPKIRWLQASGWFFNTHRIHVCYIC